MAAAAGPVRDDEFAALADRLPRLGAAGHAAVAVSGGPDSMALALLAQRWAASRGVAVTALTVDHGLRPDSAGEAAAVGQWMSARGLRHEILVWRGGPRGNLQASARQARYRLLDDWCAAHSVPVLLLAHHLEDQAETVLLRLGRGSGVYGLAAMAAEAPPPWPGAPFRVRPLLDVPKARLAETLRAMGQEWVEDPSNRNRDFARVRAREVWAGLSPLGITPERVAATARHMARAREALDAEARALVASASGFAEGGYATLSPAVLRKAHDEVALRALSLLLLGVGGNAYTPRFERLEALLERLRADDLGGGVTLAGCRIVPDGSGRVLLVREARRMEGPLILGRRPALWDGRFLARGAGLTIDRLRSGVAALRRAVPEAALKRVPAPARQVLPALFDERGLVAVPALGFCRPDAQAADLAVRFLSPLEPARP